MTPPPGIPYLLGNSVNQVQNIRSYAGFGQVTGRLSDSLRLIVGGRLTYDEIDMQYTSTGLGAPIQIISVANTPKVERNNTDFSWRGTLQYNVNPDTMFYATASRGYKGPGFSQFSTIYVRPETSRHYEVGLKSQFLDRRVTFNAALYHTAFDDFQASAFDPRKLSIFIQNAGQLVTKGFEVQFVAQPVTGLTLSGSVAYADARFKDFKNDLCYTGQPDCVAGVTDSSGRRLTNAPAVHPRFLQVDRPGHRATVLRHGSPPAGPVLDTRSGPSSARLANPSFRPLLRFRGGAGHRPSDAVSRLDTWAEQPREHAVGRVSTPRPP